MKTVFGAIALLLAVPATAQGTATADPHAGHAQHQQQGHAGMDHSRMDHSGMDHSGMDHSGMDPADHAKMMDECKKAMAEGKCKEHCEAMMKQHAAAAPATPSTEAHEGHAH